MGDINKTVNSQEKIKGWDYFPLVMRAILHGHTFWEFLVDNNKSDEGLENFLNVLKLNGHSTVQIRRNSWDDRFNNWFTTHSNLSELTEEDQSRFRDSLKFNEEEPIYEAVFNYKKGYQLRRNSDLIEAIITLKILEGWSWFRKYRRYGCDFFLHGRELRWIRKLRKGNLSRIKLPKLDRFMANDEHLIDTLDLYLMRAMNSQTTKMH